MATRVHMEALSPTMEEGQVVKWLKGEGDAVAQGDILAEIETDKATMELVARGEGALRKILVGEGGTAPVGDVIAVIAPEGEDIAALLAGLGDGVGGAAGATAGPAAETAASSGTAAAASDAAAQAQDEAPGTMRTAVPGATPAQTAASSGTPAPIPGTTPAQPAAPTGRVKASPLAKRLAGELGLEIAAVQGTGPGGRVVKRDVEMAAAAAAAAPAVAPVAPAPAVTPGEEFADVPLSQMRKTVARRLTESLGPVPHFFLTVDVDMTRALAARARVNEILAAQGAKASVNDLVIKATAAALTHHPECNAWWQGSSIRVFNRVHMGVAVAVPDGLITPVVRDAHAKGLAQISGEVREMAGRAREKKLQPHEYTGSTFSISNLGMFGIEEFTAVINPPEAGIIAVGAVEERAVAVKGEVVVQPRMRITMSCDHRVIDGAQGARFLATLKSFLEEPAAILI